MVGETSLWLTAPGAVLAICGVLALFWRVMVYLVNGAQTLKQLKVSLPAIEAEFSPNSGKTMRDRIDKLSEDTARWQRKHAADDDRRFAKVEAALDRIEDNTRR